MHISRISQGLYGFFRFVRLSGYRGLTNNTLLPILFWGALDQNPLYPPTHIPNHILVKRPLYTLLPFVCPSQLRPRSSTRDARQMTGGPDDVFSYEVRASQMSTLSPKPLRTLSHQTLNFLNRSPISRPDSTHGHAEPHIRNLSEWSLQNLMLLKPQTELKPAGGSFQLPRLLGLVKEPLLRAFKCCTRRLYGGLGQLIQGDYNQNFFGKFQAKMFYLGRSRKTFPEP